MNCTASSRSGWRLEPNSDLLNRQPVILDPRTKPMLFVVVDTEEEFDWSSPFARQNVSVRAMRHIGRVQQVFEQYGIRPTYVVDFPVATQAEGFRPLREIADAGACTIGAHLHPWVNPPLKEEISGRNSFGCNLSPDLERAKIARLTSTIESSFAIRPTVFKAGRYGLGVSTVEALVALGYEIDCSVNPYMDFSREHGPSFEGFDARPFVFTAAGDLLEIPCTTGYAGLACSVGPTVHRIASARPLAAFRLPGILARLGVVNRIMLSPEGNTAGEMRLLTRALLKSGVRTFSLSFHSPSLEAGHTPYVRTQSDLLEFFDRIASFCDFFFGEIGGTAATPHEFRSLALARTG